MALFNKDWNTYKTNWQKGFAQSGFTGGVKSLFQSSNSSSVISNDQVQILRNWNNAVKHGCTNQETFNRIIANADDNTKMYFAGLNKGKASMEGLKNAQNVAKTSTIGLTIAQTALNMAISMGLMATISLAIKGFDKLANFAKRASEAADEAFSETNNKVQEYDDELKSLDELIAKYKELKESGNLDLEGRKEVKELQNDIADLVGVQAKNLDLVNGKLDDEIKKLDEITAKEAKKAYETAISNYTNSQKASLSAVGDSSYAFMDGYAYVGDREKDAERVLQDAGFNIGIGGFLNDTVFVFDEYNRDLKALKGAQEKANYLQEMIDALEQNGQRTSELYAGLVSQRDVYLKYLDDQQDAANSVINSWLTYSQFSNKELSKINVDSIDSFEEYRNTLINEAQKDESISEILADNMLSEEDLEKIINDFMAISIKFSTWYEQWINGVRDTEGDATVLFSEVFNAKDFEESAKALKELAISGELSPETLSSTKEYIQLLEDTGLSAEDAVERIREFALGEASLSDIMSTIQSTSSLINDVESDINEHGEITFDNLQKIADQFPSLEQNIRDYLNGVEGAEDELVNKLKDCYKQDLKNYDEYYEAKQGNDEVWWSNFLTNSSDLVNKLKDNYDIDLANFSTYLLAKEKMQALIDENESKVDDWSVGIGSIMPNPLSIGGYYQGKADELKAYLEEIQKTFKDSVGTSDLDDLEDYTSGDKYGSGSDKDSSSTFDWIDTEISNMEDSLDKLDKQVSDTYSKWDTRNQKLAESIAKTNEAITLQENAAKAYMNEANSVGLSSHYKTLIQKGALNIEDIKDKDLADKISEYQDLYEKSQQCTEKAHELRQTLNELSSSEKWDLLKSESDADIEQLDKQIDAIQTALDKLDLNGMFANSSYYNDMVDLTRKKITSLLSQEKELQSILNTMTSGTEAYDTMFAELMDIRNQIAELENECIEFNNNIRDLDWEIFDFFENSISRIREEFDFLKDLLSDKDMFDDNGNMTKYADATMGLHFANIETYKKQAQDYYEEMQELQQRLVNGAGQDVLEQFREMEDLHRDIISNIRGEEQAVLDLVSQGYEEQISALERISDLTLERMDRERDLYNYQKSITEKAKEKTSLERQISVLDGDDSEESKAKLQKLRLELESVNGDIEELEYEKQRSDTEAMLNAIKDDMMEWQNQRMDDENALLEEIRSEVETKSDEIKSTLEEVAGEYGTTLSTSLTSIFGTEKPFDSVVTAINNLIDKISGIVGADDSKSDGGNKNGGSTNNTPQTPTTPTTQNTTPSTSSQKNYDNIFIHKTYSKKDLDPEHSLIDRLKNKDIQADFQSRAMYWSKIFGGTYTGSASQNRQFMSWLKENGYKNGTHSATKGWHLFDELGLGSEVIITKDGAMRQFDAGDKVINADGTNNLFTFANDPQGFLEKFGVMNYAMPAVNVKLPDVPVLRRDNTPPSVNLGGVVIDIAQVVANNPEEFASQLKQNLANNRTVQKMVQEVSLGQGLGRNSMNVKTYL